MPRRGRGVAKHAKRFDRAGDEVNLAQLWNHGEPAKRRQSSRVAALHRWSSPTGARPSMTCSVFSQASSERTLSRQPRPRSKAFSCHSTPWPSTGGSVSRKGRPLTQSGFRHRQRTAKGSQGGVRARSICARMNAARSAWPSSSSQSASARRGVSSSGSAQIAARSAS